MFRRRIDQVETFGLEKMKRFLFLVSNAFLSTCNVGSNNQNVSAVMKGGTLVLFIVSVI
jgi:hypothetical protein